MFPVSNTCEGCPAVQSRRGGSLGGLGLSADSPRRSPHLRLLCNHCPRCKDTTARHRGGTTDEMARCHDRDLWCQSGQQGGIGAYIVNGHGKTPRRSHPSDADSTAKRRSSWVVTLVPRSLPSGRAGKETAHARTRCCARSSHPRGRRHPGRCARPPDLSHAC